MPAIFRPCPSSVSSRGKCGCVGLKALPAGEGGEWETRGRARALAHLEGRGGQTWIPVLAPPDQDPQPSGGNHTEGSGYRGT